jgi:hypothetical protein
VDKIRLSEISKQVHGRVNHGSSNFSLCAVLRYAIRGPAVKCHSVYSSKFYSHLYVLKRILADTLLLIFYLNVRFLCGNKMPTACSTCFGHHYAHHQELESTIQVAAACGIWSFGFQVVGMVLQQPTNRTHNPQLHTIPTT